MVLHVFISLLGGVPLCIPYGLYNGTSLGGTTRGTLEGYLGRVLSQRFKVFSFIEPERVHPFHIFLNHMIITRGMIFMSQVSL